MLLGCSAPTVRRWIHEGHLTARKIGPGRAGLVRIPRPAVNEPVGRDGP
jgi:excisionase family DNA binding protein